MLTSLLFSLILIAGSCKKDNDSSRDCEENNYGVLKINFAAANVKHGLLITYPGGTSRNKIIDMGKISDTIRLFSGSYQIEICSVNNANQGLSCENSTVSNITVCEEREISVNF